MSNRYLHFFVCMCTLILVFINPLRQALVMDDFAFAWMVDNLLDTGKYVVHPWLFPNTPFLTFFNAGLCLLFGPSFGVMRIGTLFFSACGLSACLGILRLLYPDSEKSFVGVLVILACPVWFVASFTLMSDIPALSICLVAVWCLGKVIRFNSWKWLGLACVAWGCAIFSRQSSVCLAPCFFYCAYLLIRIDAKMWRGVVFFTLPLVAIEWQYEQAIYAPNWAVLEKQMRQHEYYADISGMMWGGGDRCVSFLVYSGLMMLPLLPALLLFFVDVIKQEHKRNAVKRCLFISIAICVGILCFQRIRLGTVPVLPTLPWMYSWFAPMPSVLRGGVTVLSYLTTALLMARIFLFFLDNSYRETLFRKRFSICLLLWFAGSFLALFFYYMIGDRYLFSVMIPLLFFAVAEIRRGVWIVTFLCICCCCVLSVHVRKQLVWEEARWNAGEEAVEMGIPKNELSIGWEWKSYHDFQKFADSHDPLRVDISSDFFGNNGWLAQEHAKAKYATIGSTSSELPDKDQIILTIPLRSGTFRKRELYLYRKLPPALQFEDE